MNINDNLINLDADVLCRYANKKCYNHRAIKKRGDLHIFCEFHRAKANRNQRRLEMKRRINKQVMNMTQTNTNMNKMIVQPSCDVMRFDGGFDFGLADSDIVDIAPNASVTVESEVGPWSAEDLHLLGIFVGIVEEVY